MNELKYQYINTVTWFTSYLTSSYLVKADHKIVNNSEIIHVSSHFARKVMLKSLTAWEHELKILFCKVLSDATIENRFWSFESHQFVSILVG